MRRPPLAVLSLGFLLSVTAPLVALGHGREGASWLDQSPADPVTENDDDDEPSGDADGTDIAGDDVDDAEDEAVTAHGASPAEGFLSHADAGRHRSKGGCGRNMVRAGEFCMDRYEAPNRRSAHPLVMQSANDADAWCAAHDKRLCTEDEWIEACQGEEHRAYPYGNEHVDGRCNDDKPWKQVDEPVLAKWPATEAKLHAKELYQATPSGSKRKCTSSVGVRDMTGNVEEWVVRTRDHANDWPYILIGCYWSGCYGGGKPTCHSTNNAHGPEFRFYETGFRCCRDLAK